MDANLKGRYKDATIRAALDKCLNCTHELLERLSEIPLDSQVLQLAEDAYLSVHCLFVQINGQPPP